MTTRSMYVFNGSTWDEVGYTIAHDVPAGGATGTVLSKSSATDYDAAWVAQSALTVAQSQVTNLTTDLSAKAPLASPTFTGVPAAPTAAVDTSTTQIATTAFTVAQIADDAVLKTVADAAGDLVVGSAADTFGRLALGTDNHVLTVDTAGSGVAKVGWEDPTANPLTTAAMALKVNTATVGNLLTANQASLESNTTTGWVLLADCTIATSNVQAKHGSYSLAATYAGASYGDFYASASIPVTAGQTYTVSGQSYAGSVARAAAAGILWFNSGGTYLATTNGTSVTNSTSGWTRHLATAVAPAGAFYARPFYRVNAAANTEVHYWDELGLWEGAGGQWALPGTPITNLGFYTDESVGRRLFQWDANNSRFQQTFGDTGWRDVSAGLEAGTTGEWRMRRVNSTVTHHVYNVTNSSGVMYTIPAGFRTASYGTVIPLTKWDLTAGAVLLNSPTSGNCTLSDGLKGYTGAYYMFTHDTSDAWPTTLPGSAVGSIPA